MSGRVVLLLARNPNFLPETGRDDECPLRSLVNGSVGPRRKGPGGDDTQVGVSGLRDCVIQQAGEVAQCCI